MFCLLLDDNLLFWIKYASFQLHDVYVIFLYLGDCLYDCLVEGFRSLNLEVEELPGVINLPGDSDIQGSVYVKYEYSWILLRGEEKGRIINKF